MMPSGPGAGVTLIGAGPVPHWLACGLMSAWQGLTQSGNRSRRAKVTDASGCKSNGANRSITWTVAVLMIAAAGQYASSASSGPNAARGEAHGFGAANQAAATRHRKDRR